MQVHLDALMRVFGIVVAATVGARKSIRRHLNRILAVGLCLLVGSVWAGSASYYYDELGRLVETVAADGTSVLYRYDAVGNITSVQHDAVSTVGIGGFIPASGPVGTSVTIFGSGFSTTPSTNVVKFNGVAATVTVATATTLTVTVPASATTGTISVTNGAATATSSLSFTVASSGLPTITSFTPTIGAQGAAVTISGTNFQTTLQTNKVSFGNFQAPVSSATATSLATVVPGPATSGKIGVTTPFGVATSAADFFDVPPGFNVTDVQFTGRVTVAGAPLVAKTTVAGKIGLILFDAVGGSTGTSLQLTNVATSGGTASVFAPDGTLVGSSPIANGLFGLSKLTMTGTYLIVLAPSAPTSLSVAVKPAATLVVDGALVSVTSAGTGYGAFLTFNGTAGQNLGLEVTGLTFSGGSGYISLSVYAPDGTQLPQTGVCSQSNPNGACNLALSNLPLTGSYLISVQNSSYPAITGAAFTLKSDKTAVLTSGTAYALSLLAGQNGRLTFAGTTGQTAIFSFKNVTTTPADQPVVLTVVKPDGTVLGTFSGSSPTNGAELNVSSLPTTGTYTLLVDAAYGLASSMSVTVNPTADLTVDGAAVNITSAATGYGTWLGFNGTTAQNIAVEITGLAFSGGSGIAYISVFAPDGTQLSATGYCDQGNPNGACNVELSNLPLTGRYQIQVQNPGYPPIIAGAVTLKSDKTAALTSGAAYSLSLLAGQNGRLTFAGTVGQAALFGFKNVTTSPANQNVVVTVLKPDGTVLTTLTGNSASNGAEANVISLPSTGTYTLLVNPAYGLATTLSMTVNPASDLVVDGAAANLSTTAAGQSTWMTFSGIAGQNLGLEVTGLTFSGGSGYIGLYVYAPDGTLMPQSANCDQSYPNGACNLALSNLPLTGRYQIQFLSAGYPAITAGAVTLKSDKTAALTSGTAYALSLVAGQNGRLTFAGTAGQAAIFSFKSVTTTPANQNVVVTVLKPDGTVLTTLTGTSASNGAEANVISLPSTGTYTLLVNPAYGLATTLSMTVNPASDLVVDGAPANLSTTATGQSTWMTFGGTTGQNLGLEVTGLTFSGGSGEISLYVYAPDGTLMPQNGYCDQSNPNGACNLALSNLPLTGRYQIQFQNSSYPPITAGMVTLKSDKTAALTSGTAYSLSLVAGQNGRLTFAGTAGQAAVFGFRSVTTTPANQNVVVTVLKPDGTVLTTLTGTSASNGAEANVSSLPSTGTYTLLVNPAYGLATTLSMTVNPASDLTVDGAAANLSTTATGQSTWMTFNGTAGQNLGLEVTGLTFSGGSGYIGLYVYAPDGTLMPQSANCDQSYPNGACNLALSNLPLTGRYQIQFQNSSYPPITAGAVTLKSDKTAALTSGTSYALSLVAGQNGRLTFTGTAGQATVLSITNAVTAPANQSVSLTVLNPDGTTLTTLGATTAAAAEWNVPSTGTYTLLVNTAYGLASTMSVMVSPPAVVAVDGAAVTMTSVAAGSSTYLTFNGTAGQNVGVELTGLTFPGGNGYAQMSVYGPDGSNLGGTICYPSNPNGACSVPLSNLPLTGRYQVQVSNPGYPATTGGSVTLRSDKIAALTSGTAYSLSLVAGQNGRLTFTGAAGQATVLSITNAATAPANQSVSLTVLNPDGTTLTTLGATTAAAAEWNVPSTGTYTLLVNPTYGLASTMSVMVSPPAVVAVDGAAVNLASVATNSSTYLTFNGTAGQNVGVELTGLTFPGGNGYAQMSVYGPDGSNLGGTICYPSNPNGACSVPLSNLPLTGRYQVQVSNPGYPATTGGSVTLRSDKIAALTSGTAYSLSLVAGQNGRLTFTGAAGQATVLSITNAATAPANQSVSLTVLNPDGTTLTTLGATTAAAAEWNVPSTGTYTLLVNPTYGLASTMSVMVSPPAVVAVDGAAVTMTSVAAGSSTYLTFNGTAGQNVGVELTGLTFSGGSGYLTLYVYAPDGSNLGAISCSQSYPNGACSLPLSNLPLTGRYQIQVSNSGYPATTGGSVTVRSDKTAVLTSGAAYTLSLAAGQNGRLTFTGTAAAHTLTLGVPTTTPAGQTVSVTVLDASSNTVSSGSYSTAGGVLTLGMLSAGTYTVIVNTAYGAATSVKLTYQ